MKYLGLSLVLFSLPAAAAPVNAVVTVGGVTYSLNNNTPGTVINNWSAVSANTGTGFDVTSPGGGSIWLTGNPYGLTNTTFTCMDSNGCPGFQFVYTLLGATIADLAVVDVFVDGAVSATTSISAMISCTATTACSYNNVAGQATVTGTFVSTSVLQAFMALPPGPPPAGQANLSLFLNFTPSGAGTFATGATVHLPNSLNLMLAPEPSTWALAAVALGVALIRKRRA